MHCSVFGLSDLLMLLLLIVYDDDDFMIMIHGCYCTSCWLDLFVVVVVVVVVSIIIIVIIIFVATPVCAYQMTDKSGIYHRLVWR